MIKLNKFEYYYFFNVIPYSYYAKNEFYECSHNVSKNGATVLQLTVYVCLTYYLMAKTYTVFSNHLNSIVVYFCLKNNQIARFEWYH